MSDKLNTTSNGASLTPPPSTQKRQNGSVLTPSETSPTKLNLSSMLTNQDLNTDCMSIEEIYKLAREFVKAKEGSKALQLTYNDRNMMNVLTKQINNCKFEEESQKVGFLDLVGKDRLQLWKSLGDLTRDEAMKSYIELIAKVCPLFVAHLEANLKHVEEEKQKLLEEEKRREMSEQKEKKLKEEDLRLLEENKKKREESQRKQIQEALNQQTYPHFKAYAEQQHPNNPQAQEELIKQLQEQHFEQYMNQVYQQQLLHQQQQAEQLRAMKRAQKKQNEQTIQHQQQLNMSSPSSMDEQFRQMNLNESNISVTTNTSQLNSSMSDPYYQQQQQQLSPNNTSQPNLNGVGVGAGVLSHEAVSVSLVSEQRETTPIPSQQPLQQPPQSQHIVMNLSETGQQPFIIPSRSNAVGNGGFEAAAQQTTGGELVAATQAALSSSEQPPEDDDENDEIELPPISAASMITRKDIKEFKESVRRDNDAIIKIGSGETVTVRVPTHEDGRLIFWEFATDYYDLGFGLYFEWTISPSNNVTVHVSDSSEDEEGEGEGEEGAAAKNDPEKGNKANENKAPIDEIIPIFRRDSHEEVYAGSHLYPGRGVYLLKFDNSYSLWRSKTLYYRVYYSK